MRAQPLVIVIRQQREKPVRPSIGHALWFSGSMASGKSFGALVVRVGVPNRRAVILLGAGPDGVFPGEIEKTAAQHWIGGIASEAAATLVRKDRKADPSDSLATRRESLWGLSVAGA